MEYSAKDAPAVFPKDPNHDSSGSNATMTYECKCSSSEPIIREYTTKDASDVVTLGINTNSRRSQGNRQSIDINDDNTIETGNET